MGAERAHTGRGIWDPLLVDDEDATEEMALQCLAEVIANTPNSHLYYKNFFLARNAESGIPVASCSGYGVATTTITASLDALKIACMSICSWSADRYEERRQKLSFLKTCFPSWPPYEGMNRCV
jgi:hypothetical protein